MIFNHSKAVKFTGLGIPLGEENALKMIHTNFFYKLLKSIKYMVKVRISCSYTWLTQHPYSLPMLNYLTVSIVTTIYVPDSSFSSSISHFRCVMYKKTKDAHTLTLDFSSLCTLTKEL